MQDDISNALNQCVNVCLFESLCVYMYAYVYGVNISYLDMHYRHLLQPHRIHMSCNIIIIWRSDTTSSTKCVQLVQTHMRICSYITYYTMRLIHRPHWAIIQLVPTLYACLADRPQNTRPTTTIIYRKGASWVFMFSIDGLLLLAVGIQFV